MKHPILLAALALLPTPLMAHEAGGAAHIHPHGVEAFLALTALAALVALWRVNRS